MECFLSLSKGVPVYTFYMSTLGNEPLDEQTVLERGYF
jgi:hypothetical protein